MNGHATAWRDLLERAERGSATVAEGVRLLREAPLFDLGRAADAVRRRLHPDGVVTYIVDRNINYTNVCSCGCSFCSFYREKDAPDAYVLSEGELSAKIVDTIAAGGVRVLLQGGLHPDWGIDEAVRLVRSVKRHPILLHGFSPPEIWHFAHRSGMTIEGVIARLKDAGLDSIPGGGAEILDDDVRRRISPKKIGWEQWAAVMREAHRQGLRSSATMMFGSVETPGAIVAHLLRVRALQEETGGSRRSSPGCSSRGTPRSPATRASGRRWPRGSDTPWGTCGCSPCRGSCCPTSRPSRYPG